MSPYSGRFQTMDSFAGGNFDPRTLHKYTYAENDAFNRIDPSGRMSIAETAGVQISWGVLAAVSVLSLATACYLQFALAETANYYGADISSVQSPCVRKTPPTRVFYRGTTSYDALEAVLQHIDIGRIMANQTSFGFSPDRMGVYFTSQLSTAFYYASISGGDGRASGPGIIVATVPSRRFMQFAITYGIPVEVPVPLAPQVGQTETLIPFFAMPEFETFARYTH